MFGKTVRQAQGVIEQTTETVIQNHNGSKGAALASAVAIIFSAISLYETVLKQANLHIYVPDTLSYTRDPYGAFEVFILPVSIVNSGAQDGIVTALKLTVTNKKTGVKREFNSNYSVDGAYFSTKSDYAKRIKRPKNPFAPLPIAGRGNYTGTLLFYPKTFSKKRVLDDKGVYAMHLTMYTTPKEDLGFLQKLLHTKLSPLNFEVSLPTISRYFEGQMFTGNTVRLFRSKVKAVPVLSDDKEKELKEKPKAKVKPAIPKAEKAPEAEVKPVTPTEKKAPEAELKPSTPVDEEKQPQE